MARVAPPRNVPPRSSSGGYKETAADIAQHFNVSVTTVRRWEAAGLIAGRRVGPRLIRYNLAEVEDALFAADDER
ncbi:helix-turn-helix domain-containing protein [Gordonia sp. CPCC 206044]|uniref:hypothetical protein n=1 Tax=Gordonia sp. CPCC 206044 TaxID=3140793 RepID=UPI003AF3F73E